MPGYQRLLNLERKKRNNHSPGKQGNYSMEKSAVSHMPYYDKIFQWYLCILLLTAMMMMIWNNDQAVADRRMEVGCCQYCLSAIEIVCDVYNHLALMQTTLV